VGLRFELGDEIYFNNGAHNNLRITFGPILRFSFCRQRWLVLNFTPASQSQIFSRTERN
jgi:hypothetical protein